MAAKAHKTCFPPVEGDPRELPHPKFNVNRVDHVVYLLPNGNFHDQPERFIMDVGDGGKSLLSFVDVQPTFD